jgi:membrane associated rhomboid family serine protease
MIPLNDTEPNRYTSWPFMVISIIATNIVIMAYEELLWSESVDSYLKHLYSFGSIPTLILSHRGGGALTSLTHMFMHGDLLHLGGNMLALWVYGRRVEDVCGPWRFLIFYLICGVFADIVSTTTRFTSDIPGIGASGAIAGIMGAYLILFPTGRIRTLVLVYIIPAFPTIRAYWLILYFFILQLPPALTSLLSETEYNINYWAHLGGFFGSLSVFLFLRPDVFHNYRNDLSL